MSDVGDTKVIPDTNALMIPMQFGVDLISEVGRLTGSQRTVIPQGVMDELEALSGSPGAARAALALARKLVDDGRAELAPHGGPEDDPVDTRVLRLAETRGYPVVTNDRDLIARLREAGVRVIRLRGRDHLDFD